MIDLLSLPFVQRGLLGAIAVGSCCSLLGVFVVLRGMSYIGAGIAHGCLSGAAFALLMGWNPLLSSAAAGLAMVAVIEAVSRKAALKMDTAIGVVFSLAMAAAVICIGLLKRYTPDIMGYLFGNLLAISPGSLAIMAAVSLIVIGFVIAFFKELQFSTFDPEMAEVSGIPARAVSLLLSILMGLAIVISLQAVGELLVLAMIVLPASTAYQLTRSLTGMAALAVLIGVSSSLAGLALAFRLDVPTGGTIVMVLGATFFLAMAFSGARKRRMARSNAKGGRS